jgi:pimeloyl-ACP methyl ester carboxylesterase
MKARSLFAATGDNGAVCSLYRESARVNDPEQNERRGDPRFLLPQPRWLVHLCCTETVTVQQQLDKYPSDIFSRVEVADGRAWMLPNGTEFFCGDLSAEEQKLVWATHYAPVADLFQQQKITSTPWKSKPSWYILTTQDHTVHPDLQRWVSKRMGATVVEVESSHVPMLSKPDVVIEVIRTAAKAIQESTTA